MKYVIGLDQGTTGTTALLFDEKQNLVGRSYKEHQQYFPKPGWVEHDAEEIFKNCIQVIQNLITESRISASDISGMGITNQRETVVLWDRKTSKPYYHAIVWQCRRTSAECERLNQIPGLAEMIQKKTGLTIDPYFTATKLSWLLQNQPHQIDSVVAGTMDSWLMWNFTKGKLHATDPTNASRTMLFDIQDQHWSDELCSQFQIPKNILPNVLPSHGSFGTIDPSFFGHSIPILGVAGDQQAALFGHDAVQAFQAKCTMGTGAFALVRCGDEPIFSKHRLLTTLACTKKSRPGYALEGSVFMAGSIIQWLRDQLKMISEASEMDALAKSISTNEGVYLVPAFVGLGAPYWKPNVRGSLTGMHLGTNKTHIARAALESIAYQISDLIHAMEQDIGKNISELAVDGGVTHSEFLMQFLSDLLQIPILRSKLIDMTAFGAAKLAALELGWSFSNPKDFFDRYEPKATRMEMDLQLDGWKKAISRTLIV